MHDYAWGLQLFVREFFIAAMLNPSLRSRFMQEFNRFSRILAGLVGYKIYPLENKKKFQKNLKKRVFIKMINNVKTFFTSMLIGTFFKSLWNSTHQRVNEMTDIRGFKSKLEKTGRFKQSHWLPLTFWNHIHYLWPPLSYGAINTLPVIQGGPKKTAQW